MQRLLLVLAAVLIGWPGLVQAQSAELAPPSNGAPSLLQPAKPVPAPSLTGGLLYSNGPLVTNPGGGAGGADLSALQTSIGLNILGFGHNAAATPAVFVADQFIVPAGQTWTINEMAFFAYQTGSTTTSTMTGVRVEIRNAAPPGGTVVFGDLTTNRLAGSVWTNIYRATDTAPTGTTRPIMRNTATVATVLTAGTYWISWGATGSLASGPWAPPISILGQATTGDGLQSLDGGTTWAAAIDNGTAATPQGFPFEVYGTCAGAGCGATAPAISVNPTSVDFGTVAAMSTNTETVTVSNPGTGALTIASIVAAGTGLTVDLTGTDLTLDPGQSTTFAVTWMPATTGTLSGTVTITSDAPSSPTVINVTGTAANLTTTAYCSGTLINMPGGQPTTTTGPFDPYPAMVTVPALAPGQTVADVNIRLVGMDHTFPDDLDIFVQHPLGPTVILMSDAGGSTDLVGADLTFDDEAAAPIPDVTGTIAAGSWQPANYGAGDTYPAPAPVPTEGAMLSAFDGANPAGMWSLWGADDVGGDFGDMNEFCVDITYGGGGGGPEIVTFPSTDTPIAIPDNTPAGITSTIVVSDVRRLTDLDVDFNATHSWTGDLIVSLARGATTATLMDRPGIPGSTFGCSGANPNIVFDDEGTDGAVETSCVNAANPGYPVPDGHYTPNQALSAFDANSAAGTYVLTVSDNAAGDTGSLDSWALIMTLEPPVAGEPTPDAVNALRVSPNPVALQGQVTFTAATSQDVRVALYDALGREVRVLLDRPMTAGQVAQIGFQTSGLAPGVYVVRATGTDLSLTQRVTVVR